MSPKKITGLALVIGGISILAVLPMVLLGPDWGLMTWWPAMGLGLAGLLLVISFFRGAYLSTQRQVAMVDKLNDCHAGISPNRNDTASSLSEKDFGSFQRQLRQPIYLYFLADLMAKAPS
jgi:hypothetical protein